MRDTPFPVTVAGDVGRRRGCSNVGAVDSAKTVLKEWIELWIILNGVFYRRLGVWKSDIGIIELRCGDCIEDSMKMPIKY